ncbi:HAMP domain-containing protein, partial [Angustibacter peucedani]
MDDRSTQQTGAVARAAATARAVVRLPRALVRRRPASGQGEQAGRRGVGLRPRILAVGGTGVVAALVVGATAVVSLGSLASTTRHLDRLQELSGALHQVRFYNADVGGWQTAYAWDARKGDPKKAVSDTSTSRAGYLKSTQALRDTLAGMPKDVMTDDEQAALARIQVLWAQFFSTDDTVVAYYAQGDPLSVDRAEATIAGPEHGIYYSINDETDALVASVTKRADAEVAAATATADRARLFVVVAVVLAAVAVAVWSAGVAGGVVRRVRRVQRALDAMADGDLTARALVRGTDEVAQMAAALGVAQESVRSVVERVALSASAVASSSEELSVSGEAVA